MLSSGESAQHPALLVIPANSLASGTARSRGFHLLVLLADFYILGNLDIP